MIEKLYDRKNRLVGVDVWRGIAIMVAIMIHYSHKADIPLMVWLGNFFEGYFSVGAVFVMVAGMMGWLKYETVVIENWGKVLAKCWRKAGELLLIYWGYIVVVRFIKGDQISGIETFWLGDPYFLGIYLVLAMIYLAAPWLLWLMKKTGGGWSLMGWAVFWFGLAAILIAQKPLSEFWGNLLYNHWRNTVPLLPMLAVYCAGAWVAWCYRTGQINRQWWLAAGLILGIYPVWRYGLNAKDIYPNNQFLVRGLMLVMAAIVAVSYKPKHAINAVIGGVAFIGAGSLWVFTVANFQIALLPGKVIVSAWPVWTQWLGWGMIMGISVMVAVSYLWFKSRRSGR